MCYYDSGLGLADPEMAQGTLWELLASGFPPHASHPSTGNTSPFSPSLPFTARSSQASFAICFPCSAVIHLLIFSPTAFFLFPGCDRQLKYRSVIYVWVFKEPQVNVFYLPTTSTTTKRLPWKVEWKSHEGRTCNAVTLESPVAPSTLCSAGSAECHRIPRG